MSDRHRERDDQSRDDRTPDVEDATVLETRIGVLEAENRRLRDQYARAKRVEYRRSALAFAAVGVLAFLLGVAFPGAHTVLFALGGTGVFAGVLTYYLTPEHVLPASVGERTFDALSSNEAAVVRELGLSSDRRYVPVEHPDADVRLFVAQHADARRPSDDALEDVFVTTGDARERGVSLRASGDALHAEYEAVRSTPPADDPTAVAEALVDALANQFELVASGDVDRVADGRIVVALDGVEFGDAAAFDHPAASLLAVGVAVSLDEAIEASVDADDDGARVVLAWPAFDA